MDKGLIYPVIFMGEGDTLGYRYVGENIIKGLSRKGIDVSILDKNCSFTNDKELINIIKKPIINDYNKLLILISPATEKLFNQISNYIEKEIYLFAMWEYDVLPEIVKNNMFFINNVIVPSMYNYKIFKKYFPDKNIYYCPLGYNSKIKYKKRTISNDKKFRFLWVGGPSLRKGWSLLIKAFQEAFRPYQPIELYIKTSPNYGDKERKINLHKNVIFDCRKVSLDELIDIYYSAHSFVFPSIGEGFGLTPLEAIISGLVTICPDHTGMKDFINDKTAIKTCYKYKRIDFKGEFYNVKAPIPDIKNLVRNMQRVYNNYENIYEKLFPYASEELSKKFTWENSINELIKIIWGNNGQR